MKRILSFALAIVMLFCAVPLSVSAAEEVKTISTVAELAAVANDLSGNYRLEKDLDLSDYGAWTPIGGSTAFSGTFEGNGKTIKGLTVNTSSQYGGLFGNVSGTVKNLNVKGTVTVNMTSSSATSVYAGLVAGNVGLFGTVDSCSAEGNVTATLSCSSSSFITPKGYAYAGGVIGSSSSFYEFSELSHKSGTVTAKASMTNKGNAFAYAGGVAGKSGATIVDSYNKGDVTATATASSGETTAYSGGISGYGKNFATSYNTGDITASGTTVANAGAIAGYATGKATNCYYLSGSATKAFGGYSSSTAPTATSLSSSNSKKKASYSGFDFDNVWEIVQLIGTPKHYDKDEIITGTVAVTGTYQYGKILTADMSGVTPSKAWNGTIKQVKYQWYRGVEEKDTESNQTVINYTAISKATSNTYKITSDDIGKYIKLVVRGRLTYGGMLESKGAKVEKLTPATPAAPTVERLGDTYVVIKAVSGAEYGYATYKEGFLGIGAGWNTPTWQTSNRIEGLSPSTKYGLYVRIPESATTNASANSAVTEITTYEEGYDPYAVKGSISVSGTGAYGNTLTADISGLAAAESGATYSYQWNRDGVAIEDVTTKSYKVVEEDIGTKISVTVTAKSPFTGTFTSSAISVSLGQPANLSIKNTDTGITLSWSKVDGATEYVVYKKGTLTWSEVATVTTNSYSVGALTSGTTYQYTVSAKRGNIESGKDSNGVKIIYLDKPQNLTVDEYTANQATVSWSAVSNAKSYNIYRGTATGTLTLLKSGVTGTEYQDTTTKKGTTYGYAVAAVSGDYASAQSNRVTLKITGTASHRYNAWVVDKEPTCTEAGSKHRDCTECTDVQTVTIPATGHNYGDWTVTKEATCSETGSHYRTCGVCGNKNEQVIPAKDHVYGAWVFDVSSTCTEEGLKHANCTLCGHYKEIIIPEKGHLETDWFIDSEATVYKAGKKHTKCTRCDEIVETLEIPQLKCSKPKLKTISNTQYGVKITWSKVKGGDKYRVYRKTKNSSYKYLGSTSNGYYTDKTAKSGTKYYYAIKARNEAGNTDYSSSLSKYYLADPTLKTPSSSSKGIALKWTKTTGAEGYIIYRKTGTGSYKKLKVEKGVSNLSYRDTSAQKDKKYTYKVKAYKSKTYSAYSNTKTIKDKY